jgi:hypothetical protein
MILPLPDREQFETELRDKIFERGDQKELAAYLRIRPSRISRQLDPYNEDCPSPSYQLVEWLWAADAGGRHELADQMIQQIIRERNKWLVNTPGRDEEEAALTAEIFEKATEFLKTESADTDLDTQLNKLEMIRQTVDKKADCLKAKLARKKGLTGGNK